MYRVDVTISLFDSPSDGWDVVNHTDVRAETREALALFFTVFGENLADGTVRLGEEPQP